MSTPAKIALIITVIRDRVNFETQILYGILSLYYATGKATSKQIAKFETQVT